MKYLYLTLMVLFLGCKTYYAPSGKAFPRNWGAPPDIQTKDYRPLPDGYGHGSSTLLYWIISNQRCGTLPPFEPLGPEPLIKNER